MPESAPFVISDDDRYSRLQLIAWWDQQKIADAKVLVVGAGALGNEVIKNLALLGIGTVYVIDMDTIEHSNLSRSVMFRANDAGHPKAQVVARRAMEINPDVTIHPIHGNVITDLGLGLFRQVDVVIGCLDNREARLWVNRCCWKVGTPWVDGGIQEINGVAKVFVPPNGSCYECTMTENDYRLIQLRYSCPLLSQEDMLAGKVPTAPTISSIIGGLQVQEALKLIHEMPSAEGSALVFNGIANQFYQTKYPRREDCLSHESYETIESCDLSYENSAEEILNWVVDKYGDQPWCIELDRDLLLELHCANCESSRTVGRPLQSVNIAEAECKSCGQTMRPETTCRVERNDSLAQRKLSELTIPPFEILRITYEHSAVFVQLSNDRQHFEKQVAQQA